MRARHVHARVSHEIRHPLRSCFLSKRTPRTQSPLPQSGDGPVVFARVLSALPGPLSDALRDKEMDNPAMLRDSPRSLQEEMVGVGGATVGVKSDGFLDDLPGLGVRRNVVFSLVSSRISSFMCVGVLSSPGLVVSGLCSEHGRWTCECFFVGFVLAGCRESTFCTRGE